MGAENMKEIIRLQKDDLIFVAIDYQEKLLPAMNGKDMIERNIIKLAKGLDVFDIPKLVTTQYAKGLGQTIGPVAEALGEFEPLDKSTFSAMGLEEFKEKLESTAKKTVVIVGIETHICVEQTALDLIQAGYRVVLAADCCGSRSEMNHSLSLMRLSQAGAVVTSAESILYEILKGAKEAEFKAISAIVK